MDHPIVERIERTGYPYKGGKKSMLDVEPKPKTIKTLPAIPFQSKKG